MKKANRMSSRNEIWKMQTECQGGMRNGKDEQNVEEECGINKKTNRMPRRNEEWKRQSECQGRMRNG